jgi:hypothetical protein
LLKNQQNSHSFIKTLGYTGRFLFRKYMKQQADALVVIPVTHAILSIRKQNNSATIDM